MNKYFHRLNADERTAIIFNAQLADKARVEHAIGTGLRSQAMRPLKVDVKSDSITIKIQKIPTRRYKVEVSVIRPSWAEYLLDIS